MSDYLPLIGFWLTITGAVGALATVWLVLGYVVSQFGPFPLALFFFLSLAYGGKTLVELTAPPAPGWSR